MKRRVRRILGLDSQYSWVKWLRISALIVALFAAGVFAVEFAWMGFFGVILFVILAVPTIAVMLGIALAIGAVIGAVQGGRKQAASFRDSRATGSAEIIALDKLRFKVQVLTFLFFVLLAAFIIICFVVYFAWGVAATIISAVVALGILAFYSIRLGRLQQQYNHSFKQDVVRRELEACFTVHTFEPKGGLDESFVRECILFPRYDRYKGNDLLVAEWNGTRFMQSDVDVYEERLEEYTDSEGYSDTRTVFVNLFSGRLVVFDYETISNDPVFVYNRGGRRAEAGEILSELDAFNQRFRIVASDAASAFRILTPQVLTGFVAASERLNVPMSFAFINNRLYIALAIGDTLEAVSKGDTTLSEMRAVVQREVQGMLALIDSVNYIIRGQPTV